MNTTTPPASQLPTTTGTAPTPQVEHHQITTRSTTAARVAASSGPAAAMAEARKSQKKRSTLADEPDQSTSAPAALLPTPLPTIMTLAIPREAIRQDAPTMAASDQYPPLEPGGTPPPFTMPIFQNEGTPTPPATPSHGYVRTVPNTPQQTDITLDISMETEEIPNVVSVPATNPLSLRAHLEAAVGRQPPPLDKSAPRNPIDKYTKSPSDGMPLVHSTSPTAALDSIDLDLISFWEQAEGQKLLAIPFDNEARLPELHEDIKNRIFTAVAEITSSQSVGVSAPQPSEEAIRRERTPTTFLIYNLSPEQHKLLLDRRVWSSLAITFLVTDLSPPCPGFLFSIKGFSTLTDTGIWEIVKRVWSDADTLAFIEELTSNLSDDVTEDAYMTARAFLGSLHISRLDVRDAGDTLSPRC
ncbi:hypothetical protein EDB89DRAFT_2077685 [Lactarius sanguifluus]|nr:hypothetical protein EDB89DRAFT_2077685 [Lactarius sanguifluus]